MWTRGRAVNGTAAGRGLADLRRRQKPERSPGRREGAQRSAAQPRRHGDTAAADAAQTRHPPPSGGDGAPTPGTPLRRETGTARTACGLSHAAVSPRETGPRRGGGSGTPPRHGCPLGEGGERAVWVGRGSARGVGRGGRGWGEAFPGADSPTAFHHTPPPPHRHHTTSGGATPPARNYTFPRGRIEPPASLNHRPAAQPSAPGARRGRAAQKRGR